MKLMLISILTVIQSSADYRLLDLYSRDKADQKFKKQMQLLASDQKGLKERDIKIREHFGHQEFRVTLTGKDGDKKYSSQAVLQLSKIYAIIDAMPMRKAEISKNKNSYQ